MHRLFDYLLTAALMLPAGHGWALEAIDTIAFGSCLRQHEPQPIWEAIIKARPDLFVFTGDNVYADTEKMDVMRAQYAKLAASPGYQRLACPVLATWDDHDYGQNDAGADYPRKHASKAVFLDFFKVPKTSPVWQRPGIYDARMFGPPERSIQLILLDTRSFRGPLKRAKPDAQCPKTKYVPHDDPSVTLLGEAQWRWLADELKKPAALRLIVSSIQVIPDQHCFEKWANLPHERTRLLQLIREMRAHGVILISGDRHLAEISKLTDSPVGYPLYELTSSGLNSAGAGKGEPNRYRLTEDNFRQDNFGLITVNWAEADPLVILQVRDATGEIALEHGFKLSELKAR